MRYHRILLGGNKLVDYFKYLDDVASMYPKDMQYVKYDVDNDLILRQVLERKRLKELKEILFELKEINKSIDYNSMNLNLLHLKIHVEINIGGLIMMTDNFPWMGVRNNG